MNVLYFLYDNKEIVYIGRTKGRYNLKQRLYSHERCGKTFNEVIYYMVDDYNECKKLERENIRHYAPKYNKQCIPGRVKRGRQYCHN